MRKLKNCRRLINPSTPDGLKPKGIETMKRYAVSLTLSIEADNEEQAKKEFWIRVDDIENDVYINNDSLEVEVE